MPQGFTTADRVAAQQAAPTEAAAAGPAGQPGAAASPAPPVPMTATNIGATLAKSPVSVVLRDWPIFIKLVFGPFDAVRRPHDRAPAQGWISKSVSTLSTSTNTTLPSSASGFINTLTLEAKALVKLFASPSVALKIPGNAYSVFTMVFQPELRRAHMFLFPSTALPHGALSGVARRLFAGPQSAAADPGNGRFLEHLMIPPAMGPGGRPPPEVVLNPFEYYLLALGVSPALPNSATSASALLFQVAREGVPRLLVGRPYNIVLLDLCNTLFGQTAPKRPRAAGGKQRAGAAPPQPPPPPPGGLAASTPEALTPDAMLALEIFKECWLWQHASAAGAGAGALVVQGQGGWAPGGPPPRPPPTYAELHALLIVLASLLAGTAPSPAGAPHARAQAVQSVEAPLLGMLKSVFSKHQATADPWLLGLGVCVWSLWVRPHTSRGMLTGKLPDWIDTVAAGSVAAAARRPLARKLARMVSGKDAAKIAAKQPGAAWSRLILEPGSAQPTGRSAQAVAAGDEAFALLLESLEPMDLGVERTEELFLLALERVIEACYDPAAPVAALDCTTRPRKAALALLSKTAEKTRGINRWFGYATAVLSPLGKAAQHDAQTALADACALLWPFKAARYAAIEGALLALTQPSPEESAAMRQAAAAARAAGGLPAASARKSVASWLVPGAGKTAVAGQPDMAGPLRLSDKGKDQVKRGLRQSDPASVRYHGRSWERPSSYEVVPLARALVRAHLYLFPEDEGEQGVGAYLSPRIEAWCRQNLRLRVLADVRLWPFGAVAFVVLAVMMR